MKRNFITAMILASVCTLSVGFVSITPQVIYGDDNRRDIYEVPEAILRDMADATVAIIPQTLLDVRADGQVYLQADSFGRKRQMCEDERFFHQPSAANCSGSLVGEDLIATAGHCVSTMTCQNYRYVFGYRMQDASLAPQSFPLSEVYACKEIVARELSGNIDYALVRLDRNVVGHRPLTLQQTPAQAGDAIYVIGHPSGLPTKIADKAVVRRQVGSYFQSNLDTYGGNSGSAVFNAQTHEVVGILVRGAMDYTYDKTRQCSKSVRCAEEGCRGEDVTNISYIIQALKR